MNVKAVIFAVRNDWVGIMNRKLKAKKIILNHTSRDRAVGSSSGSYPPDGGHWFESREIKKVALIRAN